MNIKQLKLGVHLFELRLFRGRGYRLYMDDVLMCALPYDDPKSAAVVYIKQLLIERERYYHERVQEAQSHLTQYQEALKELG